MDARCVVASLLASRSERNFNKPQDSAEKRIMHSKSVSPVINISFPPNDLTLNLMCTFLAMLKVRGGRGASSSSPYCTYAKSIARLQEVRVQTPWGKGCTLIR